MRYHYDTSFVPDGSRTVREVDVVAGGVNETLLGLMFHVRRELVHQAHVHGSEGRRGVEVMDTWDDTVI